ncbi:TetR family transcriptional regulator [Actinocatenispora thailandica]|uniref:TetR family transcriptional regulator n=1 Tax=Actinocatenispora thailandica TaxID=227318 RepID=A0A7R7HW36_9ACTN|nr:TetR/AcrR family transcriptional regulator [Actinocatenispora thailandica]BCJ34326.1 TetR family transcriptional regulator [Actinocatenispora thailandica]
MSGRAARTERSDTTKEQILLAAERLFAERGLAAVSNRQVGEAAGQGNNFAVGYHFGTKADLIRAIFRRHNDRIEEIRVELVAETAGSDSVRDWVGCLVRPLTDHLAELGSPSWFGRFGAQVTTDPALRALTTDEALARPSIQRILAGLGRCLPELPDEVGRERSDMTRLMLVHMVAEREQALADGRTLRRATWRDTADGLIDAIVGVWLAPVTRHRRSPRR